MTKPIKYSRIDDGTSREKSLFHDIFVRILLGCMFGSIVILYKVPRYELAPSVINSAVAAELLLNETNVQTEPSDLESQEPYFVHTSRCIVPYVDPLTPDVRKIYKPQSPAECAKDDPLIEPVYDVNSKRYLLHISDRVRRQFMNGSDDDVSCCYREIVRAGSGGDADKKVKLLPCANFHQDFVVPTHVDGLIVECTSSKTKKMVQQDAFAFVQYKNESPKNTTTTRVEDMKPSVLMIGIDSLSRINFRRTMPETFAYLEQKRWHELQGYNKMGDNTFPNLMALLTGLNMTTANNKCKPTTPDGLNNCEFIWDLYKSSGYRTAYAEDEGFISTFNYIKKGFKVPPTDHYLRPFVLGIDKALKIKKRFTLPYCVGRRQYGEYIYDYALEFAKRYSDDSVFGLFWTNSFSHNTFDASSSMDLKMRNYLLEFEKNGFLDTHIILFFSDHGARWGPLLKLSQGFMEERIPMFFIWLPTWFRNKYPEYVKALKINRNRLTSPYDIYMTLKHILNLDMDASELEPPQGCADCQSIFRVVPENRNCSNAGITDHWCTCIPYETLDKKSEMIQNVTNLMIDRINDYLHAKNMSSLCNKITLKTVDSAEKRLDFEKETNGTVYRVKFTALQNGASFQATSVYNESSHAVTLDVEAEVSRLNSYAKDAKCTDDKEAMKYCICKTKSDSVNFW